MSDKDVSSESILNSCRSCLDRVRKYVEKLTFYLYDQKIAAFLVHNFIEKIVIPKLRECDLKYRDWCKEYQEGDKDIREWLLENGEPEDKEWLNRNK